MLHSYDQWFINPDQYTEPEFHKPGLNSLDIPSEKMLSREQLSDDLEYVKTKIKDFID